MFYAKHPQKLDFLLSKLFLYFKKYFHHPQKKNRICPELFENFKESQKLIS
jgi:hypothetical protein